MYAPQLSEGDREAPFSLVIKCYKSENVAVVKWSVCLPSTPIIRVRFLLKRSFFPVKFVLKRTKINKKMPGLANF